MKTYVYDDLLADLRTVDDLHHIAAEIDTLLVSVFQTNPAIFKSTLETKLQRNIGTILSEMLRKQGVAFEDHEQIQAFFTGLQTYLAHLPVLQLTLAYHPTNEQIEELSDWIRTKTAKPVILHVHYDIRVIGGAIITYGGKYADKSLKKRMESVYEAKKPEILAMLK
jgi:F0F1-type ATP synthase delta subunit